MLSELRQPMGSRLVQAIVQVNLSFEVKKSQVRNVLEQCSMSIGDPFPTVGEVEQLELEQPVRDSSLKQTKLNFCSAPFGGLNHCMKTEEQGLIILLVVAQNCRHFTWLRLYESG